MNEEAAAQDYLVDYLTTDTTLSQLVNGVWTRSIPASASMPAVKIDRLDANDLYVIGLARVWDDLTFLVRGTVENVTGPGPQNWTEARAIGDQIDSLLHKHEATTSTLQIHSFREESFTDETIEAGKLYLHCGGIYRLRAHAV